MTKDEIAISVRNISKDYDFGQSGADQKELAVDESSGPNRKVHALRNVSFNIFRGEIVGIVGSNGAGKSTMLNILSRITPPTSGEVELNGTVTSILGIGAGFHPELSGRENVFLNGAILGFNKKLISENYDEIVRFSGLEQFIDSPVKFYSSGMHLRLAFSIFAKLTSDILILDEVLSVGDAAFRRKCISLIKELTKKGVTIVMVSHDISDVLMLCDRCIYLDNGEMVMQGPPKSTSEYYLEGQSNHTESETDNVVGAQSGREIFNSTNHIAWAENDAPNGTCFRLSGIKVKAATKGLGETILRSHDIEIIFELKKLTRGNDLQIGMHLTNMASLWVMCSSHAFDENFQGIGSEAGTYEVRTVIPRNMLNAGIYGIGITVSNQKFEVLGQWERLLKFRVELDEWERPQIWAANQAILRPTLFWESTKK
jgi:lipopolysaccharide transport system ATP-binding protein